MTQEPSTEAARPRLPERPCPACGAQVEPLRAGAVLLLEDGFRFLCSGDCRRRYLEGERDHDASREQLRTTTARRRAAKPPVRRKPIPTPSPDHSAAYEALAAPPIPPPWLGLGLAAAAALLAAFATHPIVAFLGALAVTGAAGAALVRGLGARREVGWLGWALPPSGAVLAAVAALAAPSADPSADPRLPLVGAAVAAAAVVVRAWLDARSSQPITQLVGALSSKMPSTVRVPTKHEEWAVVVESEEVIAGRVRTGQEVVVGEGEVVAVDGVVQAGEAFVLLHPASRTPVRRTAGQPLIAGAFVTEGEVRVLATRVGEDRALVRPRTFGDLASGRAAALTRLAARVVRWGGLAALVGAAGSLLLAAGLEGQLAAAAAVLLAAPLIAIRRASDAPYVAAAATAAERGIVFSSARTLDRAGRAAVGALCTHGTITEGEPEVVEVHTFGDEPWKPLVALVAGAESAAEGHPIAAAVARFCERRGIEPASVRRADFKAGRGVTAVAPSGEALVAGNRALLLEEGVSVAVADAHASRAEERGHTVVFVGLDGRVKAVMSLRDEDRIGARAAVQRLIDLGIEVVLVSGDHRGTVEALAKPLDITHVKAELLPDEQGAEVRRLRETGGVVAVVGRPVDQAALDAADVPVLLGSAGLPESDRAVALTSDDVRDAAAALWLAAAARRAAWRGTLVAALGGGFLVLLAAIGFAQPAVAAVLALGVDAYALPSAARLLRRIELRLPARG
ncbi:MAG: HAD family hydrolase [Myxococcota bacterium]|nr:HAD family hydrolase [Myxococcota bacterium]